MKYRKLRIAWSAVCGVLCLLLIVLWVRSYSRMESAWVRLSTTVAPGAMSYQGRVALVSDAVPKDAPGLPRFGASSSIGFREHARIVNTHLMRSTFGSYLVLPSWPLVLITATFAVAPWLPSRFSLHTLLIAMTLVAVVLGLIVAFAR